jgi:nickel-dependent lactate racemase
LERSIAFGNSKLAINLARIQRINWVHPKQSHIDWIRFALSAPLGTPPLHQLIKPGQSIAIITSDITRPCPSHLMLPPILEELEKAGVRNDDIIIVFALGTHRPHTPEEQARLIGHELYSHFHCTDSNPADTILIGTTGRGTPIEIFRPVAEADIRIALGNVEPHYFAGYSGGSKALVPGVCSQRTIQHNHAMMLDPRAQIGVLEGNPVREDLEEGAAFLGVDFILNVVIDESGNVLTAAAGHPIQAHRRICRALESFMRVPVDQLADIVIVSSGGYPKDINLYQAQKALDNALFFVRPNGVIIWLAECREGFGNEIFEEWMTEFSAKEIAARIKKQFVLGGHKAAAITRVLNHADVFLVSQLPPDKVRHSGIIPYSSVELAMEDALKKIGQDCTITVLPDGASVLPAIASK